MGEVVFSHHARVELMGFNCTQCHPITFLTKEQHKTAKMIPGVKVQSCGTCHNGKEAFDLRSLIVTFAIRGGEIDVRRKR